MLHHTAHRSPLVWHVLHILRWINFAGSCGSRRKGKKGGGDEQSQNKSSWRYFPNPRWLSSTAELRKTFLLDEERRTGRTPGAILLLQLLQFQRRRFAALATITRAPVPVAVPVVGLLPIPTSRSTRKLVTRIRFIWTEAEAGVGAAGAADEASNKRGTCRRMKRQRKNTYQERKI